VTKGDIGTDVVDRAGDSMTGDLDLQGNTLLGDAGEIQFDNPIMNVIGDMEVSGDIDADTINGTPVEEIGSQDLSEVVSEGNTAGSNIIMNAAIASITQISGQSGPILVSSNLDLQDQYSLEGIAGIVGCSSSQVLAGDGSCITPSTTLSEVLNEGNTASTNIDMNGNDILDLAFLEGDGGTIEVISDMELNGNNINDIGILESDYSDRLEVGGSTSDNSKLFVEKDVDHDSSSTSYRHFAQAILSNDVDSANAQEAVLNFRSDQAGSDSNRYGNIIFDPVDSGGQSTNVLSINAAPNEKNQLAVEGSGRVGVGTGSPTTDLDVDGSADVSGDVNIDGDLTVGGNLDVNGDIQFDGVVENQDERWHHTVLGSDYIVDGSGDARRSGSEWEEVPGLTIEYTADYPHDVSINGQFTSNNCCGNSPYNAHMRLYHSDVSQALGQPDPHQVPSWYTSDIHGYAQDVSAGTHEVFIEAYPQAGDWQFQGGNDPEVTHLTIEVIPK
jgi:hypothetical protein